MDSPLTLTMSNCYMFFFEQQIITRINNSGGLYVRYIDDISIVVNWPERHLRKQVKRWNTFDQSIQLHSQIGKNLNFLDLHIENRDGLLVTKVYHESSYEPYYLPFNSIHPFHMKKDILFAMILRAVRYCSTFPLYIQERESLRMSLLLNKYLDKAIQEQIDNMFKKINTKEPIHANSYNNVRSIIISNPYKPRQSVDCANNISIHFTFCSSMTNFSIHYHYLWDKYFSNSHINDSTPMLGTRNVQNLQRESVQKCKTLEPIGIHVKSYLFNHQVLISSSQSCFNAFNYTSFSLFCVNID